MSFSGFTSRANYAGPVKSRNELPSLTVPDMSLSLRQMLDRHNSGAKVKTFTPSYVGDDSSIPLNLERMDSVDRQQLSNQLSDFVKTTRGRLVTARQARERAEQEQSIIAAHEERRRKAQADSEPVDSDPDKPGRSSKHA